MDDKLQEIKDNYSRYDDNYGLKAEDVEWLIERAEKYESLRNKIYECNVILRIGKP